MLRNSSAISCRTLPFQIPPSEYRESLRPTMGSLRGYNISSSSNHDSNLRRPVGTIGRDTVVQIITKWIFRYFICILYETNQRCIFTDGQRPRFWATIEVEFSPFGRSPSTGVVTIWVTVSGLNSRSDGLAEVLPKSTRLDSTG